MKSDLKVIVLLKLLKCGYWRTETESNENIEQNKHKESSSLTISFFNQP